MAGHESTEDFCTYAMIFQTPSRFSNFCVGSCVLNFSRNQLLFEYVLVSNRFLD